MLMHDDVSMPHGIPKGRHVSLLCLLISENHLLIPGIDLNLKN